jgi:hypothetical protein
MHFLSLCESSGPGGRNTLGQVLKPRLDVAAEDTDADENNDRDSRDQKPIFDDILAAFVAKKVRNPMHCAGPFVWVAVTNR